MKRTAFPVPRTAAALPEATEDTPWPLGMAPHWELATAEGLHYSSGAVADRVIFLRYG